MKAILEFELPEDQDDYERCVRSNAAHTVIESMFEYLRQKLKYGELPDTVYETYEDVRDRMTEFCEDYNVKIF
jgi:hypothetical protein